MSRHRSQTDSREPDSGKVGHLPLLLARLVRMGHPRAKGAESADVAAIVEILRRSSLLARRAVPVRGVVGISAQEIAAEIEQLATTHLGLEQARHAMRQALREVEPAARRSAIDAAQNRMLEAQATAHFYAGVAFGVTMADVN